MSYLGKTQLKSSDIQRFDVTSSTSATHVLSWTAPNEQSLIITINGVKQQDDAYSIAGSPTTVTLTDALITTDKLEIVGIVDVGTMNVPGVGSVQTDQLADDAVTADKLANSINTDITANTAKVTNATHTGDVTGATALTIATDAVDIAMLSATGTADSTTFLRGDNAWATAGGDNTPSFFVRGTGTQSIANETWTKVTLAGAEAWDTDSAFASDKFTVPAGEGGKYQFTYGGAMDELDDGEYYTFSLYKNGSEWSGGDRLGQVMDRMTGTNLGTSGNGTVAMDLVATDYIELYVRHTEGGANNLLNNQCYFQGFKLIGV